MAFSDLPLLLLQQNYERDNDHDSAYDRKDVASTGILQCRALLRSTVELYCLECGV